MRHDVLIVEDEPVVVESAARILTSADLTVRHAENLAQARAELSANRFRAVLTDLMLPGTSGLEVLAAATELQPTSEVIVVTGYATCEKALECFRSGAFDFLPKPFDIDELLAVVTRALESFDLRERGAERLPADPKTGSGDHAMTGERYCLGRHSWARRDADGSATLGLGATFTELLGEVVALDIPSPSAQILQCRQLGLVRTRDGLSHRVWSPLSGRVIAVNRELQKEPGRLPRVPWEDCWLLRIVPESLREELSSLTTN